MERDTTTNRLTFDWILVQEKKKPAIKDIFDAIGKL